VIGHPVTCRTFVGRSEELAALQDARRGLARSRGSIVLIGGEAGIGKSRLLAQFLRSAEQGRARNLATAQCLESAQQPFGPIRSFLCALVGTVPPELWSTKALRAFVQLVPENIAPAIVARYRESLLEKAELFAALVETFKTVSAKRTTILSIEDLHWSDHSTLAFLNYLAPRVAGTRLLLVATYRSDELESNAPLYDAISRLLREATVAAIELKPLSTVDTRELLDGASQGVTLPAETISDIERRCEGNPFFAEELLKSAVEQPGSPGEAPLPLSLRASILQRVSIFSEDDQRVLRQAAVLGLRFDLALLAQVMNREVDSIVPALRRARGSNIVIEERAPRLRCRFRHALTRQIIYEDMLEYDRQRLHRQILQALEALGEDESHLEELAYHAWEAKDVARTLRYNERAAEAALAFRAISEAATCLQRALAAASDAADRARLLERIGSVAQLQGELRSAIDAFEAALAIRLDRAEYDAAARLVVAIVGERSNSGDDTAVAYAQAFLDEHGARLSAGARDGLLVLAARLTSASYDFALVTRLLSSVSEPTVLPPRARQNYLIAQLNKHAYYGDVAAWERNQSEFETVLPLLPPFLRVIAQYAIAQTGCYLGANRQVEAALEDARRIEVHWGFGGIDAFGAAVRALYLWLRGRLLEARACIERALEQPEISVAIQLLAFVGPLIGLALEDDMLAERCLGDEVIRGAREGAIPLDSAVTLAARATWLAGRGRLEEARGDLRLAIDMLPRATPACATVLTSAAKYLPTAELPRVIDLANAPLGDGNLAGIAIAGHVGAIFISRTGSEHAIGLAERAAQAYQTLGWPMFEAESLELTGRSDEALALFERCGAIWDARRLQGPRALPARAAPALLSPRECEIAELVTLGLTNTAIADRLAVRTKTVEKHLSSIFAKLAVRSRAQIAAFVSRGLVNGQARAALR